MLTIPFIFGNLFTWKVFVTIPDVSDNYSLTVKEIKQAIYQKYYPFLDKIQSFEDIVISDYHELTSSLCAVTDDTLIETMTSINCSCKFDSISHIFFHYSLFLAMIFSCLWDSWNF